MEGAKVIGAGVITAYPISIVATLFGTFIVLPEFIFVLIYGSIVETLVKWGQHIIDDQGKRTEEPYQYFEECRRYMTGINKAKDLFSSQLFYICFFTLVGVIVTVFRVFSFFMGGYEMSYLQITLTVGYACFGSNLGIVLYLIICMSHRLIDTTERLEDKVRDMGIQNRGQMVIDYWQQSQVIEKLKKFKGFSALDYFILEKPLLTSIYTNFITYLIVLIQFRVSEPTSTDTTENTIMTTTSQNCTF
jgi:hypothetical protein